MENQGGDKTKKPSWNSRKAFSMMNFFKSIYWAIPEY